MCSSRFVSIKKFIKNIYFIYIYRPSDGKCCRRALDEIKLLRKLHHPNIIGYVDHWWNGVGPESSRLTVVMDLAEDGDLRTPINAKADVDGRLEEVLVLSWLKQLLSGLAYVHQESILHRDLKAMNVFLKGGWRTCLVGDFGISTTLDGSHNASGCVGTPAYMAPELVYNQKYTLSVDMWAVGVILYELMVLHLPFKPGSLLQLVYQIAFSSYDEEPLKARSYSESLVTLVGRLMAKDPAVRPSAAELLREEPLWDNLIEAEAERCATEAVAEASMRMSQRQTTMHASLSSYTEESSLCDSWSGAHALSMDGEPMPLRQDCGTSSVMTSQLLAMCYQGEEAPLSSGSGAPDGELYTQDSAVAALASELQTAPLLVKDQELWQELRQTREESDLVPLSRYKDLLVRLHSNCGTREVTKDLEPFIGDPGPVPGHNVDEQPTEEEITELQARTALFLQRRGVY